MIEIRAAIESDSEVIAVLGRITFKQAFGHLFRNKSDLLNYLDRTFSVEKIKSGIGKTDNIFFLAFVDDLPVGYAKVKLNDNSEFSTSERMCCLRKIYVLEDFLSMKIGLQLQEALINRVMLHGAEEIWLSVYVENPKAIRFYFKNGFEKIGNHDFQIGVENFTYDVMRRKL
jgi:ribosomal protein S18 acetylase RimI-like enzyme